MDERDQKFLEKAMELGYLSPRQAERFAGLFQKQFPAISSFSFFLLSQKFLPPEWIEQVLQTLKKIPQIGGYEILEKLGEGGMGKVYKARKQGKIVALKVMLSHCSRNKEAVQRFIREIEIVFRLKHLNIVRAIDYGVDEERDVFYVVLEYVQGKDIETFLKEKKRFPLPEAFWIISEVAKGLQHAWDLHLIHRDIKPANIMVNHDGVIKIMDFGLSKEAGVDSITKTGAIVGTPAYMSPEQAQGEKDIDIRTDIYSLGIAFFQMVTGVLPFQGRLPMQTLMMQVTQPLPPLALYLGESGKALQPFVEKMAAKEKNKRFSTPQEIVKTILQNGWMLEPEKQKT